MKKVWIVLHHEIVFRQGQYIKDEMVFWVSNSLDHAIQGIKNCKVNPYSWWEIRTTYLNKDDEWPEHFGFYGPRGGKLKKEPYNKAVAFYKKCAVIIGKSVRNSLSLNGD